jgi:hypothetical protein
VHWFLPGLRIALRASLVRQIMLPHREFFPPRSELNSGQKKCRVPAAESLTAPEAWSAEQHHQHLDLVGSLNVSARVIGNSQKELI